MLARPDRRIFAVPIRPRSASRRLGPHSPESIPPWRNCDSDSGSGKHGENPSTGLRFLKPDSFSYQIPPLYLDVDLDVDLDHHCAWKAS